jgi:hypothetical protein
MHFLRPLLVVGSLLSTACIAAPAPHAGQDVKVSLPTNNTIPASHLAAAAAGIDIYGEIPSDYLHKNGSAYHFAPGSNASIWVRAQIDKPWSPPNSTLSERQVGSVSHPPFSSSPPSYPINLLTASLPQYAYSGLAIGVWGDYACQGYGTWIDNVEYIIDDYATPYAGFYSTAIAYRAMYSWEHLDYSTWNGISYCGDYLYSAGYETPPGCWSSMQFYCFRLWYD